MSRLNEAQQRLQAALTRLEQAVEARARRGEGARRDDEAGTLAELRAENDGLREASAEAGQRLDQAIARLEGVLRD
jgi:hypothetical protein